MDEKGFELAEAATQALVDNGIKKVRSQIKARDPDFCGECLECGEPIPEARLDTGAETCIECQQDLEHQAKQYKR